MASAFRGWVAVCYQLRLSLPAQDGSLQPDHSPLEEAPVSSYTVTRLDQIEEISDGRSPFRPVRHHFGITSFGVNAFTGAAAGDRIVNEHDESEEHNRSEELYLVHSGRARFELDGESLDAPAGTFVFVPPDVKRTAFAEQPDTTIVVMGGSPGRVYRAAGWELWVPIVPLYEAGEYDRAAERLGELAAAHPEYPLLAYNLACCESMAGHPEQALEHLHGVLAAQPDMRAMVAEDSDLEAVRALPGYAQLAAGEG